MALLNLSIYSISKPLTSANISFVNLFDEIVHIPYMKQTMENPQTYTPESQKYAPVTGKLAPDSSQLHLNMGNRERPRKQVPNE